MVTEGLGRFGFRRFGREDDGSSKTLPKTFEDEDEYDQEQREKGKFFIFKCSYRVFSKF